MSNTVYKAGSVPTVRYRVLAIVFFLLALAGLFLGYLGNYVGLLAHSGATLYAQSGIALNAGTLVKGTLFGYIFSMLKYFFTGGHLAFSGQSFGYIALELLGLAQVLFLALAVVLSLVLGIAACIGKGKTTRNCAMLSGYLVALAYLWVFVTVLFYGTNTDTASLTLLGVTFALDFPTLIVGGATLLILLVVSICRRKFVGLFNVLSVLLMAACAAIFCAKGDSIFINYANDFIGGKIGDMVIRISVAVLIGLLTFNLVLSVLRLNAKRFYPFDAVRYALLLLAVIVFNVVIIVKMPLEGGRWALFHRAHFAVYGNIALLGASLLAFLFGIFNSLLICKRRRDRNARNVAAQLSKDSIDRDGDGYEAPYAPAPAATSDNYDAAPAPAYPYNQPAPQPQPYPAPQPYAPYSQPAPQPQQPVIQPVVQPMPFPVPTPQAAPAPAPQPMPMPMPMPIPMPMPMGMGMGMGMGMQPPMRPMPPFQQPAPQPAPAPAPIVLQQAPATPPVVILQMPPVYPQPVPVPYLQPVQQIVAQPQQQALPAPAPQPEPQPAPQPEPQPQPEPAPAPQPEPQPEPAPAPAPQPEPQPAPAPAPAPAPQPEPIQENTLSAFERQMLAMARAMAEENESAPQGAPAQPAQAAQAAPAQAEQTGKYANGYDSFIETLTEDEKSEFHALFINHVKGDFGLPTYVIGGDNQEFFGRVFGAIPQFNKYISPELLDKIFDYGN